MNTFKMKYEWADLAGSGEPQLDATFAYLEFLVDGQSALTILDKRANTTTCRLLLPLYPLAEWLVANWWSLLYEPKTIGRNITEYDYLSRHSFRHAGQGFAFPDLRVYPEGADARMEWRPRTTRHQNVDFLTSGTAEVSLAEITHAMADLIESVLTRLATRGVDSTDLMADWHASQHAPDSEKSFCQAVARLGLDPYDLDKDFASLVMETWERLPKSLRADTFDAVDAPVLQAATDWIQHGLSSISSSTATDGVWPDLRKRLGPIEVSDTPWTQGYDLALKLRNLLGIGDMEHVDLDTLPGGLMPIVAGRLPPRTSLDAIVANSPAGAPCCYTAKLRPESQRFVRARAIFDGIANATGDPWLLSSAQTSRQQVGRAFAAEFLAPARLLKRQLVADQANADQLGDLAAAFGVSSYVIEHQIRNHDLAVLPDD